MPDGSSIDGETTFTISGNTHTAATVTFATDPNGYAVSTTSTTNSGDGSTVLVTSALNPDGSIAYYQYLNTLISSSTTSGITTVTIDKTLTDLNNGGLVTSLQTDDTTSADVAGVTGAGSHGDYLADTAQLVSSG